MESNEEIQVKSIRSTLLKLPNNEIRERRIIRRNYIFYKGKSVDLEAAKNNPILYGQNWSVDDNCDYNPTQDIRNKIKPLLRKQSRWMFGVEPTIKFKSDNKEDKDQCEELRKFIEDILDSNSFWTTTKKAFLEATIKKRVLLRVEANPNSPLIIKYESIENFYYKEKNRRLLYVVFFEEDEENVYKESDTEKIYYLHTYYYKFTDKNERQAWYKKETYKNTDLQKDLTIEVDTGFSIIPCWLIENGGELNDSFGESDVEELMDTQAQYNKTISDVRDAIRFMMFGAESIIDGNEDDVSKLTVAPNALHAIRTRDELASTGKQALMQRLEYNMGNSEAIEAYLDRAEADMNFTMDMPKLADLNNIPSAKAMGYLYNDLIARCEDKWNDWTPAFIGLFEFIKEVGSTCYSAKYNKVWNQLNYSTLFEHNYPLPSDTEDKKKIAMEEVKYNVKSIRAYIRDFSDEEDAEFAKQEILEDLADVTAVENEQFVTGDDNNGDLNG